MFSQKLRKMILWVQGIYSLITAIWPIADIESFMEISGYKTDIWLVKTVSVLLIAISVCLLLSTSSKELNFPVAVLALITSVSLAYVDFYYALNGTISKIYMADGIAEILFAICWIIILIKNPAKAGSLSGSRNIT